LSSTEPAAYQPSVYEGGFGRKNGARQARKRRERGRRGKRGREGRDG
jgi:hypothetical protein